jgi:hypothetical protein
MEGCPVMKYLLPAIVLALLSSFTQAEQYLCVAETAAWVNISDDGKEISSGSGGMNNNYIFSNNDGEWKAKAINDDNWTHTNCNESGTNCKFASPDQEAKGLIGSVIQRNARNGTFLHTDLVGDDTSTSRIFIAGKCSEF